MTYEFSGKRPESPQELLSYWIAERYRVFKHKAAGLPKPWSADPIFQDVYFCNVHREDDRVTRWIREFYSPFFKDLDFTANLCIARIFNWPETLEDIGFLNYKLGYLPIGDEDPQRRIERLIMSSVNLRQTQRQKVWSGAYVITTHGLPMSKAEYCSHVLGEAFGYLRDKGSRYTLAASHALIQGLEGFGSFLAAQVVADLKNTYGHPLADAEDWWTWSAPGPGSLRGLSWYYGHKISPGGYQQAMDHLRWQMDHNGGWPEGVPPACNQDLQNCLCEYDKFMRVLHGTGRSKRKYDGRN